MSRRIKHHGYSLVKPRPIQKYLTNVRESLIQDIGGKEDNLTAQQVLIIDAVINLLGICRCMEEHIREVGVMRGHDVAPCLKSHYLAYRNAIQRHLVVLGIEKREITGRVLTPAELAAVVDLEVAEEKAKEKKG